MIKLELDQTEIKDINEVLDDPCISENIKKKLLAIRMSALNVKRSTIAKTLNVSADSVTNYIKMYVDGGLPNILENRYYRPSSAIETFLEDIKKSLDDEPVSTAKEAASRIEKISGVLLSESQTRRVLKKLGFQHRKTAPIPGKADPQLQFDFLTDELLPRLQEAQDGKRRVFFVDASHFVLGAFLGMIWCLSRVFIRTGSGRQRYNVLGAVETRDHDLITISNESSVNAETICALIEKIDLRYPEEEITLVMDNARYQHNKMVKQLAYEKGIEILYLPPYSPNLNLIERVWGLVKKQCLNNKYYENADSFKGAIHDFIESLSGDNRHLLKSLISEKFQLFKFPNS